MRESTILLAYGFSAGSLVLMAESKGSPDDGISQAVDIAVSKKDIERLIETTDRIEKILLGNGELGLCGQVVCLNQTVYGTSNKVGLESEVRDLKYTAIKYGALASFIVAVLGFLGLNGLSEFLK